jgi:hypothetical protein
MLLGLLEVARNQKKLVKWARTDTRPVTAQLPHCLRNGPADSMVVLLNVPVAVAVGPLGGMVLCTLSQ